MTYRDEPDREYLPRAQAELARGERPYCTVRVFSGERADFRGHRCGNRVPEGETEDLRCSRHQGMEAKRAAEAEARKAAATERQERERVLASRLEQLPQQLNAKGVYMRHSGYSSTRVEVDLEALERLLSPAREESTR